MRQMASLAGQTERHDTLANETLDARGLGASALYTLLGGVGCCWREALEGGMENVVQALS